MALSPPPPPGPSSGPESQSTPDNGGDRREPTEINDNIAYAAQQQLHGTRAPIWARRRNSDSAAESPWARKIVLSLDGGGVRGYASLLILQALMGRVRVLERQRAKAQREAKRKAAKAAKRQQATFDSTQVRSDESDNDDEVDDSDELRNSSAAYCWGSGIPPPQDPKEGVPKHADCFRPHHYFDYFFGTSTGGLSAMMLGRLQMTVTHALDQYNNVATYVFGRKQRYTMGGTRGPKFKDEKLEEALQYVTQRDRLDIQLPSGGISDAAETSDPKEDYARRAKTVRLANGNPDAARTTVLTHGTYNGGATREIRMFRSYDHRNPNSLSRGKKPAESAVEENHLKPLEACNLPLWRAGRATTAAPTYFSPYKIGRDTYRDGGIGANNPVKFAYDEVRQMHSRHYPRLIISIGTGVQREREYTPKKGIKAFLLDSTGVLSDFEDDFKQSVMNAEDQHRKFSDFVEKENRSKKTEEALKARQIDGSPGYIKTDKVEKTNRADPITYVRFNVPLKEQSGKDDLTDVKLSDWHGTNGADTKAIMNEAVNKYLETQEDQLDKCAEILVNIREQRQETVRWERFALHMAYGCPERCQELELESRLKLREHLVRDHGFVWQVPCIDHEQEFDRPWSCFWDECAEKRVTVFKEREDFEEHLRHTHKMEDPKIVTNDQLEQTLNRGRKVKQPRTMSPQQTFTSRKQSELSQKPTGLTQRVVTGLTTKTNKK